MSKGKKALLGLPILTKILIFIHLTVPKSNIFLTSLMITASVFITLEIVNGIGITQSKKEK